MRLKIIALAVIVFGGSLPALAHAILLNATPAANQVVVGGKIPVQLRFNSRIDTRRSSITLVNSVGREFPLTIEGQPSENVIDATAEALSAGSYLLRWQVLAADGHISRGQIPFRAK